MFNTKPCKQSDSGPGQGNEGELGWPVLVDKIKIGSPVPLPDDPSDHREPPNGWAGENNYPDEDDPPYFNSPRPPKVFCGVYTYHKKHYLLEAATHTWAYRCDGGPGYTLNRVTLKWLVTEAFAKSDYRQDAGEDRLMGFILRPYVRCYDTHDANGGMRYLGWAPQHYGKSCDEMRCGREMANQFNYWKEFIKRNVSGIDSVSSQAVSFHLMRSPVWIKRVHSILYRSCPPGTALGDALGGTL
eukprot:scaffold135666_cov70-Cyclotella_meneghiniana.AAC.3